MTQIEQIKEMLSRCSVGQRREIFEYLRAEFLIHPIEEKLNTQAEIILEAIDRASDLTLRGIRGVIAEASFEITVVNRLTGWEDITPDGNFPYDFLLRDSVGSVRIQVKMQRLKHHIPMTANQAYKFLPSDHWVTETQRTRGGKDASGGDTRPYRYGEFDILAVSMHPSTKDWSKFMYAIDAWLMPRPDKPNLLLKFQPVAKTPNDCWTDDFETCVSWFRAGEKKIICTPKQLND